MAKQVFPTKNNLINAKKSIVLAVRGYDLMERKKNILVREMMSMIECAKSIQSEIDETYARAYLSLQKANISLGICDAAAKSIPIDNSLSLDLRSVMGIEIPIVRLEESPVDLYYGLETTNSYLDDAYLNFREVKKLTAKLAETESGVYRLADAVKKAKKRSNALNNVIIPQLKGTIKFISDSLEEKEREDFSRLKVIKGRNEE